MPKKGRNNGGAASSGVVQASGSGSKPLKIRFPLRLRSSPDSCGLAGLGLTCSGNDTILSLPPLPPFKVTAIDYRYSQLTINLGSGSGSRPEPECPLQTLISLVSQLRTPIYYPIGHKIIWLRCPRKSVRGQDPEEIVGPIRSCSAGGGADDLVYVVSV